MEDHVYLVIIIHEVINLDYTTLINLMKDICKSQDIQDLRGNVRTG